MKGSSAVAHRSKIETFTNDWLSVDRDEDYGPNGLQIQGADDVRLIVSGVSASLAMIWRRAR